MSDVDDMRAYVASLQVNAKQVADRLRNIEDRLDTLSSPVWKRLMFRLDGWGPWYRLRERPRWRPWHRWWVS